MPLNNSQYDAIMRGYNRRQDRNRNLMEERRREVFAALPRIREIEDEIASVSVQCGRRLLFGEDGALTELKESIERLGRERAALLAQNGYSADYLEMKYDCPDCRDQGFVDGQKCHCFKKAEIDLLYAQSNLRDILQRENFDTFSYAYYTDEVRDPDTGETSLARIRTAVKYCRQFIDEFDRAPGNLFFYGEPGVGKTFLSHCIARELLETTHSVVYFSAQELFETLAQKRFGKPGDAESTDTGMIYDCDLLIIDDLGTELTNAFVSSELFLCVNERLTNRKATIISTNLSLEAFAQMYSERIFSRISANYTLIKLFGPDIRLLKKFGKNAL